jgi:hypothetical protein
MTIVTATAPDIPTDSLQGSILGQMVDSSQCADCMSILSGADTVVEAAGWAEIGVASAVTGAFALDSVGTIGASELAPTVETANTYMDALGLTDNVVVSGEATLGSNTAMTLQGDIALSQSSF